MCSAALNGPPRESRTSNKAAKAELAPHADTNDGKIDVVVVHCTSRWQMFRLLNKIYDGSHLSLSCVEYHQVQSLSITTVSRECLNLAGELKGATPMSADVMHDTLQILV